MCSWQQVTAGLGDAHGLASYPSLGSASGDPSAAKSADDLVDARVEGLFAAAVGQPAAIQTPGTPDSWAARRGGVQGAGDDIKGSHADLGNQAGLEQAHQIASSRTSPRTDARRAVAQAGSKSSTGQTVAEVEKASRKRAADTSSPEHATKRWL